MCNDKRATVPCPACDKPFRPHKRRGGQQRYCSRACWRTRLALTCQQCGRQFTRARSLSGPYCSRACATAAQYDRWPRPQPRDRAAMLTARQAGESLAAIAARFGVARSTVWRLTHGKAQT